MKRLLVLVIEDDASCRDLVAAAMLEEGHIVHIAKDLKDGYGEIERAKPDLIVLDRGLPDGDGMKLCLTLRKDPRFSAIPILMLSGNAEVADRVLGLRFGADDYLSKPFDMEEFLARAAALVRRASPELVNCRLECGGLAIDLNARQVKAGEESIPLSGREYELLRVLMGRANTPVTRDFLLEAVWEKAPGTAGHKTVDVTIMNLRRKLGALGGMIVSVRGFGYKLTDAGE